MKLSTLQKFGGFSLIAGSALLTVYSVCFSLLPVNGVHRDPVTAINDPNWVWLAVVVFIGVIFMMFGFMAVYSKMHEETGVTGFLGFIVVEIAYLLQAAKVTWEICLYPVISANNAFAPLLRDSIIKNSPLVYILNMTAMFSILIGIILFCLAIFRSGKFPRSAGIIVFAGALIYGFGPMLTVIVAISGIFIFSVGCLILGLKLMKGQAAAV